MIGGRPWTPDEDAVLSAYYPDGGWQAVHRLLTDRSRRAIYNRASELDVKVAHRLRVQRGMAAARLRRTASTKPECLA